MTVAHLLGAKPRPWRLRP